MVDSGVFVTIVGAEPSISRIWRDVIVSISKEKPICEKKYWGVLKEKGAPGLHTTFSNDQFGWSWRHFLGAF
jgi:hypothetical protein